MISPLHDLRGLLPGGLLLVGAAAWPCRAQDAVPPTFRVTGTVRTLTGVPLGGVSVVVNHPSSRDFATGRTAADGRYAVTVLARGGRYVVTATRSGMRAASVAIERTDGDTGTVTVDAVLEPQDAQLMNTVRIGAQRPRPPREAGIAYPRGGEQVNVLGELGGLTGDLTGDLSAELGMLPGLVYAAGTLGPEPSVSGLASELNGRTLNGIFAADGPIPRDGMVNIARISTYDPRFGGSAGVQINSTLRMGDEEVRRSARVTVDDPGLQRTTRGSDLLGTRYRELIGSGAMSGRTLSGSLAYSGAFQAGSRSHRLMTFETAPAVSLSAVGLAQDARAHLVSTAHAVGLPLGGAQSSSEATSGSVIGRVDFLGSGSAANANGTQRTLVAKIGWQNDDDVWSNPLSAASRLGERQHRDATLIGTHSTYIFSGLSETNVGVSFQRDATVPRTLMPSVSVFTDATGGADSPGGVNVQLGGAPVSGSATRRIVSITNAFAWYSMDRTHLIQSWLEAVNEGARRTMYVNDRGSYRYESVVDFALGRPAAYSRTLGELSGRSSLAHFAFGLSDTYNPQAATGMAFLPTLGTNAMVQYGFRIDSDRLSMDAVDLRNIESAFGRQVNTAPRETVVQPMVGVTITHGLVRTNTGATTFNSNSRHTFRFGVRKYRSMPSTAMLSAPGGGLADANPRIVECVGDAIPRPDWNGATVMEGPDACLGDGSPYATAVPGVTFFARDYRQPVTWRGDAIWSLQLTPMSAIYVAASNGLTTGFRDPVDLNFDPTPGFVLPDEANRPVFVPAADIVGTTGAMVIGGSRANPAFGRVTELQSTLRSHATSFSLGMRSRVIGLPDGPTTPFVPPRFAVGFNANYTYGVFREQRSGFAATTAGNPLESTWSAAALPTHSLQFVLSLERYGWLRLDLSARLSSGFRYTPLVSADINGDGRAADRAFVFDPGDTRFPTLAQEMSDLLSSAPEAAVRCLRDQVGQIAAQNSCTAPWSATLGTIALTVDPLRLGLGSRGSMTLYVSNALGALDQLLHGESRLRGWGQMAIPDPTLLYVRGFDADARRFDYQVNPRFGSVRSGSVASRPPFRVSVDFRFDIGPNRESQAIQRLMAARRPDDSSRVDATRLKDAFVNPISAPYTDVRLLLIVQDSLGLSGEQIARLTGLDERYRVSRDSIYTELAGYLASWTGPYTAAAPREAWHRVVAAAARLRFTIGDQARRVLSDSQFERFRLKYSALSLVHSEEWLDRLLKGPLTAPW